MKASERFLDRTLNQWSSNLGERILLRFLKFRLRKRVSQRLDSKTSSKLPYMVTIMMLESQLD